MPNFEHPGNDCPDSSPFSSASYYAERARDAAYLVTHNSEKAAEAKERDERSAYYRSYPSYRTRLSVLDSFDCLP